MKNIFKKKTKSLSTLIVNYINSQLPPAFNASEALTRDDDTVIMVHLANSKGIQFSLDFEEELSELSSSDKEHLVKVVILPALKELDKNLYDAHKQVEETVKKLGGK